MAFMGDSPISSVVIAGAGGFGLEVFDYLQEHVLEGGPPVAGYIDDTLGIASPVGHEAPVLGTIRDFCPRDGQAVVVAIGSVKARYAVMSRLWENGVYTPPFIAPGAIVYGCPARFRRDRELHYPGTAWEHRGPLDPLAYCPDCDRMLAPQFRHGRGGER